MPLLRTCSEHESYDVLHWKQEQEDIDRSEPHQQRITSKGSPGLALDEQSPSEPVPEHSHYDATKSASPPGLDRSAFFDTSSDSTEDQVDWSKTTGPITSTLQGLGTTHPMAPSPCLPIPVQFLQETTISSPPTPESPFQYANRYRQN